MISKLLAFFRVNRVNPRPRWDYNRMTPTGETFGERKYYHDHGTLSPGEIAIAHAIRDQLRRNKNEADQEGAYDDIEV